MTKKAIIFHGTDCSPDGESSFWYPWLRDRLTERGFDVEVPYYPEINHEPIGTFICKVLANHEFAPSTTIVGHSAGGPLALSILQRLGRPIRQTIMVAGFYRPLPGGENPVLESAYDWKRIQENGGDITYVNSDNDPWGCDDKQGSEMLEKTGGTLFVQHDGHFGSTSFNQPYPTFELLDQIIKD